MHTSGDAIFAAILSARCAASLSRRAARRRGNGWKFFFFSCLGMSACGWPTRLPLVAPASCLRSSGGVHAADGCHTRTSMSARWLSQTVALSSLAERRPITHFKPFGSVGTSTQCSAAWLNLSLRSRFSRGGFDGRLRTDSAAVVTASGGNVFRGGGFKHLRLLQASTFRFQ